MPFSIYKCRIRLGGSLLNEVRRDDVTAAEILILQLIHGNDAVLDIEENDKPKPLLDDAGGKIARTPEYERQRLQARYGPALDKLEDIRSINGVFGVHGALPETLPGMEPKKKTRGRPKADAPEPEPEDIPLEEMV